MYDRVVDHHQFNVSGVHIWRAHRTSTIASTNLENVLDA